MNIEYIIYQIERAKTPAEQRQIDDHAGQLAATVTRALTRYVRRLAVR